MITTAELLPLLEKAFGLPVDLDSAVVQDDGQTLVVWTKQLPPGEMRLELDPPILISSDGQTMTWADGRPGNAFTLQDLAEANPAEEANRHPLTRALALRLAERLRTLNLTSPSGAAALVSALDELDIRPQSAAALVASATGHDFWELMKHAIFSFEYRYHDPVSYPAPFSAEEEDAARGVVSEPWFTEELRKHCTIEEGGLYLPVVANENAGVF